MAEAVAAVRAQQRAGLPPPYDPAETRVRCRDSSAGVLFPLKGLWKEV